MPRLLGLHHFHLFLAASVLGCGESSEEIAERETTEAIDARKEQFQADPAAFVMARHRPGEALFTWKIISDADCDLDIIHIWTPHEAHILRQIPYVVRGYPMASEDLRIFFDVDAEWYDPQEEVSGFQPTPEEIQCSKKLKELEQRYKASDEPFPEAAESRFLQDPEAFRTWFQWGSARLSMPYHDIRVYLDDEGAWVWEADGANCSDLDVVSPNQRCTRYTLICPQIPEGLTPLEVPCEGMVMDRIMVQPEDLEPTEGE